MTICINVLCRVGRSVKLLSGFHILFDILCDILTVCDWNWRGHVATCSKCTFYYHLMGVLYQQYNVHIYIHCCKNSIVFIIWNILSLSGIYSISTRVTVSLTGSGKQQNYLVQVLMHMYDHGCHRVLMMMMWEYFSEMAAWERFECTYI